MSHGIGPFQTFAQNGLRQWIGPRNVNYNDTISFVLQAGTLVNTLGQNNGHNGEVTTFAGWDQHGSMSVLGFAGNVGWTFDHYGASLHNGVLVQDTGLAYYHVVDPLNHGNDGYVLLTGHTPIPTDLVFG